MIKEIFVGPTAFGLERSAFSAFDVVNGPIARGDIESRLVEGGIRILCIVDGYFGSIPSVGHKELLQALEYGWQVWGLSSIGAIRAVELKPFGMMGYGRIYRYLRRYSAIPDDILALTHLPFPPFQPETQPLIDLGQLLRELRRDGHISIADERAAIHELGRIWFGYRTEEECDRLLRFYAPMDAIASARNRSANVKQRDLVLFLRDEPWNAVE